MPTLFKAMLRLVGNVARPSTRATTVLITVVFIFVVVILITIIRLPSLTTVRSLCPDNAGIVDDGFVQQFSKRLPGIMTKVVKPLQNRRRHKVIVKVLQTWTAFICCLLKVPPLDERSVLELVFLLNTLIAESSSGSDDVNKKALYGLVENFVQPYLLLNCSRMPSILVFVLSRTDLANSQFCSRLHFALADLAEGCGFSAVLEMLNNNSDHMCIELHIAFVLVGGGRETPSSPANAHLAEARWKRCKTINEDDYDPHHHRQVTVVILIVPIVVRFPSSSSPGSSSSS